MAPDSGEMKPMRTGPWADASSVAPSTPTRATTTIAIRTRMGSLPPSSRGEPEQRRHLGRAEHGRHLRLRRRMLEAAGRVQDLREEREVTGGVDEDLRQAEDPVNGPVDVRLGLQRLIPRRVRPVRGRPRAARDRLDDL